MEQEDRSQAHQAETPSEEAAQAAAPNAENGISEPEAAARDGSDLFTVVGIGASAGGLEALRRFLEPIPPDSGMAFVVVVHLSPEHQSHLAELLQSHTPLPVTQVKEMVEMEPNHVYVIPPNRNLSSIDTHLRLSALEESRRERAPIDHFFRTLARTHNSKAIGVVLSGSGSDGAVGLKAIKEAGGLILAQEPEEAAYDGMPQSAIATGIVDDVLPVAEMAGRMLTYVSTEPLLPPVEEEPEARREEMHEARLLQQVFARLRTVTGHDFSRYKRGTVGRRLARRMQLHGKSSLEGYLALLRADPDEVRALFRDLLIVVTNFFRDQESFEALAEQVMPALFEGKGAGDEIRVWVPGCATGEEAYSLAILLLEEAERRSHPPTIQLFATDLSQEGLAVGREGVYPQAIAADVSPERLERFFVEENGAYRVREEVRERVLFAPHSLLRDPPFSHLDLVSCRNLLIYLRRDVQGQLLELFHYALDPGGFLFLGSSESVDDRALFAPSSAQHSIFRRQEVSGATPRLPSLPLTEPAWLPEPEAAPRRHRQQVNYGNLHEQLAERHAPPSILVDADHRVVHVSARAGRYLQIGGGELSDSALRLVRDALQGELATLLYRAFHRNSTSRSAPLAVEFEGKRRAVSLYVEPTEEQGESFALVFFLESDVADAAGTGSALPAGDEGRDRRIQELEEELARTKRELRTALEEFESSKEEMKASNEELQSINEELRSTTEELETSKEELQSMNEELVTVNEENKQKVVALREMTADLQNLMAATDIATLFLDRELRIQRFTPAASALFNIRHSDRGRPLAHLTHKLARYDGLLDDAAQVLKTLVPVEEEVVDDEGRHYLLRIGPYRTADDRIDGVVITLVEITSLREAERALARSRERYRLLVESTTEYAIFTMGEEGRVDSWNAGAQRILGYKAEEIVGKSGAILYTPEDRESGVFKRELRRAREAGQAMKERWHLRKDGSRFWGSGVLTSLWDEGALRGYANVMRDNTARKEAEETLRESRQALQRLAEELEERVEARTAQVRRLASELVASEQTVRHRLARSLHDDLQQLLYAAEAQVELAKASPGEAEELAELAQILGEAIEVTRQVTVDLSPPVLRGEGLPEALQWLANQMRELHDLRVKVAVDEGYHSGSQEQRVLLFQMVRELLFNVVQHAGVEEARVQVGQTAEGVRVTVADQGRGFDMEAALAENDNAGLRRVRERIELFDGQMEIASQPGGGTHVILFLPSGMLNPPAEEAGDRVEP